MVVEKAYELLPDGYKYRKTRGIVNRVALIFTRTVYKQIGYIPEDASAYFVSIGRDYLSEPYHLEDGCKVYGDVLSGFRGKERFRFLEGRPIVLILQTGEIIDNLFIERDHWDKYFRDWGLVKPSYELNLRLSGIIDEKGIITQKLYEKRDVSV